jgi:hypothetical protein
MLVIFDGGVASLVATLLAEHPERSIAWLPPTGSPSLDAPAHAVGEACSAAAERLVELLGMKGLERPAPVWRGNGPMPAHLMLWLACQDARRLGCESVLWPVVAGHDPDAMVAADETAALVARLSWLNPPEVRDRKDIAPDIKTPLADLTREQVTDLALDLDAPVDGVWWFRPTAIGAETAGMAEITAAQDAKLLWNKALDASARRRGFAAIAP